MYRQNGKIVLSSGLFFTRNYASEQQLLELVLLVWSGQYLSDTEEENELIQH